MIIREITDTDIKAVSDVLISAYEDEPWNENWTRERAIIRIKVILCNYQAIGLKANDEKEIVGAVLGFVDPYSNEDFFYILELFVKSERKGQGIGAALYKQLRANNIKAMQLILIQNLEKDIEKSNWKRMEECTEMIELLKIRENENIAKQAANWFHQKWGIPLRAYQESICDCLKNENVVPQWYLAMDNHVIVGGLGVIENDFHNRKDLTPNVCAVYVDEDYRCQGIAGKLLQYVCDDMKEQGIDTFYLVTDHTSFYEKYGWEFLCMVQGDGEPDMTRMYIHQL